MEQLMEKRPRYQTVPLEQMLLTLSAYEDEAWYPYAFSREPLNGRFTDWQRQTWMRQALACGREYARKIGALCGSSAPARIAEYLGLKVSCPEFPEHGDRVLFAEFREPNQVNLFMDAVKRADLLLAKPQVRSLLGERLHLPDVLLAHEIFHFIEEQHRGEIYTKTEKVRLWSLGILHNDSVIIALGEIAAMAFAKELNQLSYLPYVLDVFLVYAYSQNEACGLYQEITRMQNEANESKNEEE